jgi:RNA polymerase sigma factor (sigma-70 family)
MNLMQDQKILELLRSQKQEKGFYLLYKEFPKVRKLITSNGGKKEDAEDLFQEALIVLYRKATEPSFTLTSSAGTYLYSICRYMWKDELKKRNRTVALKAEQDMEKLESDFNEAVEKENKLKLAEDIIRSLGEKCRELLRLFYFEMLSMKSIAQKLGFSSEKIAKNQKYKCIERAKNKLADLS